jgi:hypothetical protein
MLLEGQPVTDPAAFVRRMNELLANRSGPATA